MTPNIEQIRPEVGVYNQLGFYDASELVQSVRTFNSVTQPVGTATLVFNPGINSRISTTITHNRIVNELERKLKLNSIISIKIDRNAEHHTFLGRIDNIYPRISAENNGTRRELVVNCSMLLPKLLLRDDIINAPMISILPEAKKALGEERTKFMKFMRGARDDKGNYFIKQKPEDAVKFILKNCLATNSTVMIGANKGLLLKTFINPEKAETLRFNFLEGETLFNLGLTAYAGPILNYIMQCIDPDFYEVFFDTETGNDGLAYNTMTIRPKPFSYKDYTASPYTRFREWPMFDKDLKTVYKTSEDRISDATGRSDYELKNAFTVNFLISLIASPNSYLGHFGTHFPLINFNNVNKYGLRHLQLASQLVNFDKIKEVHNKQINEKSAVDDLSKLLNEEKIGANHTELDNLFDKREKAFEWYAYPYFASGQIVWVGDANIRAGQRLVFKDKDYYDEENDKIIKGVEFYINSVAHDFAYGRFFKTTTEVTRGAPEGVVAEWQNKNRKDFISPSIMDYNSKFKNDNTIDAIYKDNTLDNIFNSMESDIHYG